MKAWYGSKRRKKPEAVARTLVAKEIARIVYHVLRKEEDFNGQFKCKALSRTKKEPPRLWRRGPYSQARPAELATADAKATDRPRWE